MIGRVAITDLSPTIYFGGEFVPVKAIVNEEILVKFNEKNVKNIQKYSDLPVAVGFGVRDPKTAKAVSKISDGVVIGSRIVKEIEESDKVEIIPNVKKFFESLNYRLDKISESRWINNPNISSGVGQAAPETGVKRTASSLPSGFIPLHKI